MIRKLLSTLLAGASLTASANPQQGFALGKATVVPPHGWRIVERNEERLVFQAEMNQQRATITLMKFGATPSFEDFKLLCEHRYAAERKFLTDGFIDPDTPNPFKEGDTFGMHYSGEERKTHRLFSSYFSLKQKELLTVYVEGLGVPTSEHLNSFKLFVAGIRRL